MHMKKNKHHNLTNNGGYNRGGTLKLPEGKTGFRLLCHVFNIGGVIGHAGALIKQIEQQTASTIRIQKPVRDCVDRVIVVVASEVVNKTITVKGESEDEEEMLDVSAAQEALLRVFERILTIEEEDEGKRVTGTNCDVGGQRCCRLLAHASQIGALMDKGGKNILRICNETGTMIRVLRHETAPACASSSDVLIHITGGKFAVKKALITISRCLQDCPPIGFDQQNIVSIKRLFVLDKPVRVVNKPVNKKANRAFLDPQPHLSSSPPLKEISDDHADNIHDQEAQNKVVFRMLCSKNIVGGVIGKGGTVIRILQNVTGASIAFEAYVAGCDERVITISAMENPEASNFIAQNAAVQVFARFIEVAIENGILPSIRNGEQVIARLVIASNQTSCLTGEEGSIVSEIKEKTGAEIQISGGDSLPSCALENEEVVQIMGEYRNVQHALLEVTGRLMDNCYPNMVFKGEGAKIYPSSAIPDINPSRRPHESLPVSRQSLGRPLNRHQEGIEQGMQSLRLSNQVGRSLPKFHCPQLQQAARPPITTGIGNGGVAARRMGGNTGSAPKSLLVINTTVEVQLPAAAYATIYGANLKRIMQITGAKAFFRNSLPGKRGATLVISGTLDQVEIAQALLQYLI